MAWVRLDHKFHWDVAIEALSDAAYRLYVGALCFCNWQETDGTIPARQVNLVAQRMSTRRMRAAIVELEAAGLWEVRSSGGYVIKNYLKFQPSRAQLEEQRETMRNLGRAGGVASGLKRRASSDTVVPEPLKPVTSRPSRHVTTVSSDAVGVVENPPTNGGDPERLKQWAARLRQTPIGFRQ